MRTEPDTATAREVRRLAGHHTKRGLMPLV